MNQNFKTIIKTFLALLLLSLAWLIGYFMGIDMGKTKTESAVNQQMDETNNLGPQIPPVINPENSQNNNSNNSLPQIPPAVK